MRAVYHESPGVVPECVRGRVVCWVTNRTGNEAFPLTGLCGTKVLKLFQIFAARFFLLQSYFHFITEFSSAGCVLPVQK